MGFPVSPFAPENLVSRDRFDRPVLRQPAHSLHPGLNHQSSICCLLTGLLPLSAAASIYLYQPPYAIESVPRLSGHAIIAYRWRPLPRFRPDMASSPQDSSCSGCCLFRYHHGPSLARLSFPHPLLAQSTYYMQYRKYRRCVQQQIGTRNSNHVKLCEHMEGRTMIVFMFVSHLRPMGLNVLGCVSHLLQRCHPACWGHYVYFHLCPVLAYDFAS